MTEKTLEKAIEIKRHIDRLRDRKNELEMHKTLCWGNTSEVKGRSFEVVIADGGRIKGVSISAEAAKLAMNHEIQNTDEILKNYLTDLLEMN